MRMDARWSTKVVVRTTNRGDRQSRRRILAPTPLVGADRGAGIVARLANSRLLFAAPCFAPSSQASILSRPRGAYSEVPGLETLRREEERVVPRVAAGGCAAPENSSRGTVDRWRTR